MPIKHAFVSGKADGADTTLVRPVDWNANHTENEKVVRVATDVSNSTVTFADITGLSFAIAASADYIFEAWLIFQTAATGTGIKVSCNGPASPVAVVMHTVIPIGITLYASDSCLASRAYDTGTPSVSIDTANANMLCKVNGIVRNGTTAGTFVLRFASEVAASAVTIKAGSILRYRKVNG